MLHFCMYDTQTDTHIYVVHKVYLKWLLYTFNEIPIFLIFYLIYDFIKFPCYYLKFVHSIWKHIPMYSGAITWQTPESCNVMTALKCQLLLPHHYYHPRSTSSRTPFPSIVFSRVDQWRALTEIWKSEKEDSILCISTWARYMDRGEDWRITWWSPLGSWKHQHPQSWASQAGLRTTWLAINPSVVDKLWILGEIQRILPFQYLHI